MKKTIFALGIVLLTVSPAMAQQVVGTFGSWTVYADHSEGQICYMVAAPAKQDSSKPARRGDAYLYVTHWTADNKNEVSAAIGYAPDATQAMVLSVKGSDYPMFAKDETLWASDDGVDDAIVTNIRKGETLTVTATSRRGTKTTDTYDLSGSIDAYKAMKKACGF